MVRILAELSSGGRDRGRIREPRPETTGESSAERNPIIASADEVGYITVSLAGLQVENLILLFGANGTGNGVANVITGNSANVLDGGACNGVSGNDTLDGVAGNDVFALTTALGAGNGNLSLPTARAPVPRFSSRPSQTGRRPSARRISR